MARLRQNDVVRYVTDDIADVELRREIELAIDNDPEVAAWYRDAKQAIETMCDVDLPDGLVHDPVWDALTPDSLAALHYMCPHPMQASSPPVHLDAEPFPFRRPATDFALDDATRHGGSKRSSKRKGVYRAWFAPLTAVTTSAGNVLRVGHWLELWRDDTATRLGIRIPLDDPTAPDYADLHGAVLMVRLSGAPYTLAIVTLRASRDPSILTLPRASARFTRSAAARRDPTSLCGECLIDKRPEDILLCGFCVSIQRTKRS